MALETEQIDEIRCVVLIGLEHLFTEITNKYNTKENHDKMLYLLDIESALKQRLMEVEVKQKAGIN